MNYSIFRNNVLVVIVKPSDSSELVQKTQSDDYIRMSFVLNYFVLLKVGDYIIFEKENQQYFLNKPPRVIESPMNYQYECVFEGGIHELKKTKVFLSTPKVGGGAYKDYKFPLTGNSLTLLQFIVENLNRGGGEYIVGIYKDTSEITVEFNNWNVFEAITEITNQLSIGWYLQGKTLSFDNKNKQTSYLFQVGRGSGIINLIQNRIDSENIETVVYGYGGTKNMPPRTAETGITYDSENLTENRLTFEGVGGESRLEKNVDLYGSIESIQEFNDIYPNRTGLVTSISSDFRQFFDAGIDFDVNEYLLAGIAPKITFLTGKLIGLTFNISFIYSTKQITMDLYSDESGSYPNLLIYASVGDTYKMFDIFMPESYITAASLNLQNVTQTYLDKQSKPKAIYEAELDDSFIQSHNIVLYLGDLIRIISAPFEIDSTWDIKELTQKITKPNQYSIKFGDVLPKSLVNLLKQTNFKTTQSIYSVQNNSVTNNQVTNIVGEDLSWQQL